MKFRKKPVEIEAMRIEADDSNEDGSESFLDPNRRSIAEVSGWMLGNGFRDFKVCGDGPFGVVIETLDCDVTVFPGDWIILNEYGDFCRCEPDIFEATYEPVDAR